MTAKRILLLAALALGLVASSGKPAYAELLFSNMRFQGIAVVDGIHVSFADLGRNYTILVDFQGEGVPDRVLLRTRWDDGAVDRVDEAPFDVLPTAPPPAPSSFARAPSTPPDRAPSSGGWRTTGLERATPSSSDWWSAEGKISGRCESINDR